MTALVCPGTENWPENEAVGTNCFCFEPSARWTAVLLWSLQEATSFPLRTPTTALHGDSSLELKDPRLTEQAQECSQ